MDEFTRIANIVTGLPRGVTLVNLKIVEITRPVLIFIINSECCKYDIILDLDLISVFRLNLNHNVELMQTSCNSTEIKTSLPSNNGKSKVENQSITRITNLFL